MKVLLIHNHYLQAGGEDVSFTNYCQMLQMHGHEVVTYERDNLEIEAYHAMQKAGLMASTIWARGSYQAFCHLLEHERPHVAHIVNFFPLISPSVYDACRKYHVPVVQELPNYRLLCPAATFMRNGRICIDCLGKIPWRGVIHRCYRHSRAQSAAVTLMLTVHRWLKTWQIKIDAYIALSEFCRQQFIAGGIPAKKIQVKPNFVLSDPGMRETHEGFGLYVGRLAPEKGIGTLIKAWRYLPEQTLKVVGDGSASASLKQLKNELNLYSVEFPGTLPHEEVTNVLKRAQFIVIPSEWYEPFGNVVIEAFACGVPVIAANSGTLGEIVKDGETGLLFQPGNIEDLAQKLTWAFAHPEEMEQMGRNGRKQYETHYTMEANYQKLIEIYNAVLAK